jgi:WD40 repeat protein
MKTVGILKGHRRGIWCVEFSPVEQVLASSSADKTVKIWSVKDHTCLRVSALLVFLSAQCYCQTLEAHDSSVLRVAFVTAGMQLLTTSSDGLMKLWTIKSNDCVGTFDAHTDKVTLPTTLVLLSSDTCCNRYGLWRYAAMVRKSSQAALTLSSTFGATTHCKSGRIRQRRLRILFSRMIIPYHWI